MSERYIASDESHMHRGLPWVVLDRQGNTVWQEYVCECRTEDHARLVAHALNAQDDARRRLEVGPAVVYQGAKENAPSAKGGAMARNLEDGERGY